MSSGRLQQQFIRLWQCCDGKTQDTTLNELADLLSCSRRHMRTLLNTMQERGWLTWEAEVGRGKRSRLTFLYTGLALQQQRAEDLLEQDRIDQLVQLVGDKTAVRQMLVCAFPGCAPLRTYCPPAADALGTGRLATYR